MHNLGIHRVDDNDNDGGLSNETFLNVSDADPRTLPDDTDTESSQDSGDDDSAFDSNTEDRDVPIVNKSSPLTILDSDDDNDDCAIDSDTEVAIVGVQAVDSGDISESDLTSLTSSSDEESALTVEFIQPPTAERPPITRSRPLSLKGYGLVFNFDNAFSVTEAKVEGFKINSVRHNLCYQLYYHISLNLY